MVLWEDVRVLGTTQLMLIVTCISVPAAENIWIVICMLVDDARLKVDTRLLLCLTPVSVDNYFCVLPCLDVIV